MSNSVKRVSVRAFLAALAGGTLLSEEEAARLRAEEGVRNLAGNAARFRAEAAEAEAKAAVTGDLEDLRSVELIRGFATRTESAHAEALAGLEAMSRAA